ncbi:hypothetical protein J4558_16080 [Leptolyngbya sp. 15MV]|nr:hypothetical protein J4558_16080 [Leptolyngbya sp. 15MV]
MTPEHAPSPGPHDGAAQGMSRLNPAALGVADAARVLTRIGVVGGKPVTEEMLRADIDAGAPTNANGTINLVHYAAWLVKEMNTGGD